MGEARDHRSAAASRSMTEVSNKHQQRFETAAENSKKEKEEEEKIKVRDWEDV